MSILKAAPVLLSLLALAGGAGAQDAGGHGAHGSAAQGSAALPEACRAEASGGHQMSGMAETPDMAGMDEAHQELMASMMQTMPDMMQGMMAPDIDKAFLCGMIVHHQSAIDMSKVILEHGKDEWAKELARKIIAAQEQEIAEMKERLESAAQ